MGGRERKKRDGGEKRRDEERERIKKRGEWVSRVTWKPC